MPTVTSLTTRGILCDMQVMLFLVIGVAVTLGGYRNPDFLGVVFLAYAVLLGVRRV